MPASDEELMLAVRQGDLDAFEQLVERHQGAAWNAAWRFLGDAAEAEDVAQQAFLNILEAAGRYEPSAKFTTYLYRIVTRLCIDHSRKKQPTYTDDLPARAAPASSPAEAAEQRERDEAVRAAIATLPDRQRMAVVLRYYEGLSGAEIAAAMATSAKAVERLLARGRACLEDELREWMAE
ncbi:MAG: RNA polymerase sigma factor, partial [Planctomycetota bacterium]